jgi:hypothetical protein
LRTAIYESIPASERALAHAEAALLLERDGAEAERLALHLLRSEPGGDPRVPVLLYGGADEPRRLWGSRASAAEAAWVGLGSSQPR